MKISAAGSAFIMALLLLLGPFSMLSAQSHAALAVVPSAQAAEDAEMQEMAESSPMEELDPREATWKTWIGPIIIAIFGIALVFLIRRFSRAEANRDVDPPDPK